MSEASLPWALVVVGKPAGAAGAAATGAQSKVDPPLTVLGRALSLTSVAKTGCLVEDRLRPYWDAVTQRLWPSNVFSLTPTKQLVEGVAESLRSIGRQEPDATVILIPFNHCAVEELTWLDSAKGALRLGAANRNTVYFLHDNPQNDPRSALEKPQICSSSVMVGSVAALLTVCEGTRATTIVDLVVDEPVAEQLAAFTDSSQGQHAPLNLVHVRLVEEYARLQRQDVWHRKVRQVDLLA